MCEFNIKRISAVNSDPEKDRCGCYKRGDIINVKPDGEYIGKDSNTILAVPGLSHIKVDKLMEDRQELVPQIVSIREKAYQLDKNEVETIFVNDKEYTLYMSRYVEPVLLSNTDGVRTYSCKELETYQRRRFRIPESVMQQLFPQNVFRREITKAQFLNHLNKLLDKTFGITIGETGWKQALIDSINGV